MSDQKVKVGITGLGFAGVEHLKGYQEYSRSEVLAVCDLNQERAEQVAEEYNVPFIYTDHREMLANDDINAIKLNTYVTRNDVDFTNYGPGMSEYGEMDGGKMRKKVTDTYTYNTLAFRTDLQEKLMRKNNMVAWQNKQFPKYTQQARMRHN